MIHLFLLVLYFWYFRDFLVDADIQYSS